MTKIDFQQEGGGSLDTLTYDYDENGNRTSLAFGNALQAVPEVFENPSYNDANELLAFNSNKSMQYDENGNMWLYVWDGYGFISYHFNARNQLAEVAGAWGYTVNAKFRYDALGRRIEKKVDGVTTNYIYDGLDVVAAVTGAGVVKYVRTLNIDEPLARIQPGGVVRYYHADALGSVIALTDNTGTVKTAYRYSPFGQTEAYGEASTNPYQYTGRENDGPTLLYHYRARYYSPLLRRFISEDPIGFAGGDVNWYAYTDSVGKPPETNLYAYTRNSPVNYVDPLGLFEMPPQGGISTPVSYMPRDREPLSRRDKCVWLLRAAGVAPCFGFGLGSNVALPGSGIFVGIGCRIFFEALAQQICPDEPVQTNCDQ